MSKYIKFIAIGLFVVAVVAFMQSHRHKLQLVFKKQSELFKQITIKGKPNVKECYLRRGEVLAIRQVIAHTKLQGVTEDNQKAFFINAYNFAVIAELNEHFPLHSIEEEPSFFDSKTFLVAGQEFNLKTLRAYIWTRFEDPRIHFCLYLGGLSSPKIPIEAFFHKNIDKELTELTKRFVNDLTCVKVKSRSKMVLLPEFMKWSISDFNVNNKQEFVRFLNKYRSLDEQISSKYMVDYYPYSWKIE